VKWPGRENAGFFRTGLLGRLLGILLLVVALEFALNAFVFERANEFSLQEEDAASISDRLVVAYRLIDHAPVETRQSVAQELSTNHFRIRWSRETARRAASLELDTLRSQIVAQEEELGRAGLRLHLEPLSGGGNVAGSMILSDRTVMRFSAEVHETFKLNAQRVVMLLLPTALLMLVGGLLVGAALRPLRKLVAASRKVGELEDPEPVPLAGSQEARDLINAFNEMQDRIHQLISNRQLTISAIAHDLRTPLARLQMRLDQQRPDRDSMAADVAEMRMLLQSLQTFNEGHDHRGPVERIDIAATAQTLVDDACDRGLDADYEGPGHLEMQGRALALRRVMSNLIENALHYAGNVHVRLAQEGKEVIVMVMDDGPGIAESQIDEVLKPFVRLDHARARNTPGMGLGLAIVNRIVRAQGGSFSIANRTSGGLCATIRLPLDGPE